MTVQILGYNKVDYTKDAADRSFYKFFCAEPAAGKITYGRRCFEVLCSTNYAETKLLPAFDEAKDIHIGWDKKDGRSFLYVKK